MTAPTASGTAVPYRSAIAPTNGSAAPQRRFWIASASEKTSRPKPSSCVMGWRKKPITERGPKVRIAIRQPHAMITTGVRQPRLGCGAGAVVAILFPPWRGRERSGGGGCGPQHGLFLDRQIDHRRQYAESHRKPPHNVVRAGAPVEQTAHPGAEESADLMAEEGKAIESRKPAGAEHQRNEARRRRHGGEPHQSHPGGEQQRRDRARRQQHE